MGAWYAGGMKHPALLLIAGLASWFFELDQEGVRLVRDLGEISGGVPFFTGFPLNANGLALLLFGILPQPLMAVCYFAIKSL